MARGHLLAVAAALATVPPGAPAQGQPAAEPRLAMTVTAPPGFEDLTAPQPVVVDVFMGGVRVGEAMAIVQPGHFRFADAAKLVAALPDIADRPRVQAALARPDLDPHPEAICPPTAPTCPRPVPDVAAIVFDQARYRVDILVNPRLLTAKAAVRLQYLPLPEQAPALINIMSGTVSGSGGQATQYYVQDSAIIGLGTGRIRATFQQSSDSGFQTDTLTAQIDRPGWRATAGAFWIPGNALLDRIKMVGVGISSQFDTRLDRDQLAGSPLILFLDQRARVDILVNGHVMSSLVYDPGNQALDTSSLPEGSYTVTLRITSASGAVRQEQRFFSRNAALPPMGHDTFFLYAGTLVRDNAGFVGDISRTPLFQAGWARRLRSDLSLDLGVIGTDRRQWLSAGATVLRSAWQLSGALDVSNSGGFGVYGHFSSLSTGPLQIDLDARHIATPGGGPLLPTTAVVVPASGGIAYAPYSGAYTQFSGQIGYRVGQGRLALVGTYRRQVGSRDYALGPALYTPLLRWQAVALDLSASYTATSAGPQAYFGLNLRVVQPRTTTTLTGGGQFARGEGGFDRQAQGGIDVARRFDDVLGARIQADGGLQHSNGISYAQAQMQARSALGDANFNLAQPFADGATQFGASLHTALVVGEGGAHFSEGSGGESMLVIHIDSDTPDAQYEVLVDNRAVGTADGGRDVTLALPAYRAYAVRIRAKGQALSDYDGNVRLVSLYPGNVAWLDWRARQVVAVFGRLVLPDGRPLANAEITAGSDVAQSDESGHFLIQTSQGTTLSVRSRSGLACRVTLGALHPVAGYVALGDQICQPAAPPADLALSLPQPKARP